MTIPIENVMNGIPKRVSMRSISVFGLSQITIVFEDDADNAYVRNLANQLLGTVTLPPGAQASLSPDATPIGEIYRYTLRASPGFPPEEVRALEDWVVEKKMRSVPGVVDVNPFGGLTKQYQVLVDPAKLKSYSSPCSRFLPRCPMATPTPAALTSSTARNSTSCAASVWSIIYATSRTLPWTRAMARPSASATLARWSSAMR